MKRKIVRPQIKKKKNIVEYMRMNKKHTHKSIWRETIKHNGAREMAGNMDG